MMYPDFIEQLILENEYAQLSPAQQQQVAEWIENEADYNNIRSLLRGLQKAAPAKETTLPPPHIKNNLLAAYSTRHQKQAGISVRRVYAIAAVAASLVLVAVAVFVFITQNPSPQTAGQQPSPSPTNTAQQPQISSKNEVPIPQNTPGKTGDNPAVVPNPLVTPTPETAAAIQQNSVAAATHPDLTALTVAVF